MDGEFCRRRIVAEQRIFRHGVIPFGFMPGVTTEQLEQFADELDAKAAVPERLY